MSVPVLDVVCPGCNAQPGRPCTQTTEKTRREVNWQHLSRHELAERTEPAEPPVSARMKVAEATLTSMQNDPTVTMVSCDCGSDLEIAQETTAEEFAVILDHAMYAHGTRRDLILHRAVVLVTGWELGVMLGAPTQTDAEAQWRGERSAAIV